MCRRLLCRALDQSHRLPQHRDRLARYLARQRLDQDWYAGHADERDDARILKNAHPEASRDHWRHDRPAEGGALYGLFAEVANRADPELVSREDNGEIHAVHCDERAPTLRGEAWQHAAEMCDLKRIIGEMSTGLLKLQSQKKPADQH